jgi:hypothetical protein
MHWTFRDDKTRVPQPDEYFGFVYVITNKVTTKQYIGCKQYWQMRKRKKHKPSNWRVYTSSSKDLNEDIDKLGKRRFKFEIIQEYKTKRGLHYYEQYYQMKHHVLTAVIEGTDEPAYYNKNIGGIRFYVPLEKWEDPEFVQKMSEGAKARWTDPEYRKKVSEGVKARWADPEYRKTQSQVVSKTMCKGPYRITFDTGKEITIDSLRNWAEENNYHNPILFDMLNNRERQRLKGTNTKAYRRKKHKDIIKVERLSDEEEE